MVVNPVISSERSKQPLAIKNIPRLVSRPIGDKVYHTWQPTKYVKRLGFAQESFGTDEAKAIRRSVELNAQVKASRGELSRAGLKPVLAPGSFKHAIALYRGHEEIGIAPSDDWSDLAPRTRKDYGQYLDEIERIYGLVLVRDFTEEDARDLKGRFRMRPYAGNYLLRVLSILIGFAAARRRIFGKFDNPMARVKKFGKKQGVTARRRYWTFDDEASFIETAEAHDPEMAIYYYLLAYTGQRPGDVRGMDEADYDGEKIQVVQDKTDMEVWIHVHVDLKTALDVHLQRRRERGRLGGTLIADKNGERFNENFAATRWNAVAKVANIDTELQRRDLRRTAVVRLAEAGCEVPLIASITGHSTSSAHQILETYLVRTSKMAKSAIIKLESYTAAVREARRESAEKGDD